MDAASFSMDLMPGEQWAVCGVDRGTVGAAIRKSWLDLKSEIER